MCQPFEVSHGTNANMLFVLCSALCVSFYRVFGDQWDDSEAGWSLDWRSMVKHQPLQVYERQLCLSCLTGIYGCRWKRYQRSHDDTSKVSYPFAKPSCCDVKCFGTDLHEPYLRQVHTAPTKCNFSNKQTLAFLIRRVIIMIWLIQNQ